MGSGGKLSAAGTADRHTLWGPDAGEAARPAGVCSPRPPEAGRTPFLLLGWLQRPRLTERNSVHCTCWQNANIQRAHLHF